MLRTALISLVTLIGEILPSYNRINAAAGEACRRSQKAIWATTRPAAVLSGSTSIFQLLSGIIMLTYLCYRYIRCVCIGAENILPALHHVLSSTWCRMADRDCRPFHAQTCPSVRHGSTDCRPPSLPPLLGPLFCSASNHICTQGTASSSPYYCGLVSLGRAGVH